MLRCKNNCLPVVKKTMIISASRRTDIPAFFSDWFLKILRDGSVKVSNPMNKKQIRTVLLNRAFVDAFVFWSKNPKPFFPVLDVLDKAGYPYYFLYTLNDYPQAIEPGVPPLEERIETMKQLADRIGPDRVVWRYDPILLTRVISPEQHRERFEKLADSLSGSVNTCIFSFYTPYRKTSRSMAQLGFILPDSDQKRDLVRHLAAVTAKKGIELTACCCPDDYTDLSVRPAACIDPDRLTLITGKTFNRKKDSGQRPECHCISSVDIGTYRTCRHNCRYCYAGSAAK